MSTSVSFSPKHRHSDGRRFATRVWVQAPGNASCFLFHVHAEAAHRMVLDGVAVADPDGKRVWKIMLVRSADPAQRKGLPTPPTIASYMGQRYVYRAAVGHREDGKPLTAATFKHIPECDKWAYRLAQSDCLTE